LNGKPKHKALQCKRRRWVQGTSLLGRVWHTSFRKAGSQDGLALQIGGSTDNSESAHVCVVHFSDCSTRYLLGLGLATSRSLYKSSHCAERGKRLQNHLIVLLLGVKKVRNGTTDAYFRHGWSNDGQSHHLWPRDPLRLLQFGQLLRQLDQKRAGPRNHINAQNVN
jgi:hypothetical protein